MKARSKVCFTPHFTDPSCSPGHLPSQTCLSRLGQPLPLFSHEEPHSPHRPATPLGPRPETRLLEALAARHPAPSATGSPSPEKPASCCRQGVRLPLRSRGRPETRPPAGPGRRPSCPSFPRPAPGQDGPGGPQGGGGGRRPLATCGDPHSPCRSSRGPPPGSQASCGVSAAPTAAHPGRDSLASERPRSARGPGEVAGGRGRGSAPSTASAPPPAEEEKLESPEHNSPRLAPAAARAAASAGAGHSASCPRTPRSSPSSPSARPLLAVPAHSPASCGRIPRPHPARTPAPFPVAWANGSAPLLHKREGAEPGGDGGP